MESDVQQYFEEVFDESDESPQNQVVKRSDRVQNEVESAVLCTIILLLILILVPVIRVARF
jgi:hypothetical protein